MRLTPILARGPCRLRRRKPRRTDNRDIAPADGDDAAFYRDRLAEWEGALAE